jgi:phosphoribosyl 1,2-cyclic phosphodiesterase
MQFLILGSSSAGNCALISTPETKVLIDAGFSGLKIRRVLEDMGIPLESIDGVFLTHEHADHTSGVLGLSKYDHLTFFANEDTSNAVQRRLKRGLNWEIFETNKTFKFKDLQIKTVSVPHDAYDPVGYIFKHTAKTKPAQSTSLAWVTDLGHMPLSVKKALYDVDLLVLEANYDEDLLEKDTTRPEAIKQRIRGRHGHLSNMDTHAFLTQSPEAKWKHVQLVHLSKDCNNIDLVKNLFEKTHPEVAFKLGICDPNGWGEEPWIDLNALS